MTSFPGLFNHGELEICRQRIFIDYLDQEKEDLKVDFSTLITVIPRLREIFSFKSFLRAKILYTSRSFHLNENLVGLVPIIDMIISAPEDHINAEWRLFDD